MEKEKLYDKWTATGLETIKACVEDKIANYCELNKKQCQEVLNLIEKQQKEIERLKEEAIGDTKFDKLLFSIRMLHFHNYVNDKQFAEMIKKLSNENKGE